MGFNISGRCHHPRERLGASIWKIVPALATLCNVVLKRDKEAPFMPLRLGERCLEAGVPPGVVNGLPGSA
jgi:acyl-CoA reductase-like NAD-dependent aldehyde dehydrogenase